MNDSNCLQAPLHVFFERTNAADAPARKYCKPCPVKQECLVFALLTEPPNVTRYGVFGDTGPSERTKLYNLLKEKDLV